MNEYIVIGAVVAVCLAYVGHRFMLAKKGGGCGCGSCGCAGKEPDDSEMACKDNCPGA